MLNELIVYFRLVFFFSATMYYLFPNKVIKAAIVNVGTLIMNKLTMNRRGYSRTRSKLSFYLL